MDDAKYIFFTDSKEKKVTARSAKNKVTHTGCNLPSDYLSKREKNRLNGEVKTVNIHKPMMYSYFKMLAKDVQEEYLNWLILEFNARLADISDMLHVSKTSFFNYVKKKELNVHWIQKPNKNPLRQQEWDHFCAGEPWEEKPIMDKILDNAENIGDLDPALAKMFLDEAKENDQNASESLENAPETVLGREEDTVPSEADAIFDRPEEDEKNGLNYPYPWEFDRIEQPKVQNFSITLNDVNRWDQLFDILKAIPLPASNTVTVTIEGGCE